MRNHRKHGMKHQVWGVVPIFKQNFGWKIWEWNIASEHSCVFFGSVEKTWHWQKRLQFRSFQYFQWKKSMLTRSLEEDPSIWMGDCGHQLSTCSLERWQKLCGKSDRQLSVKYSSRSVCSWPKLLGSSVKPGRFWSFTTKTKMGSGLQGPRFIGTYISET